MVRSRVVRQDVPRQINSEGPTACEPSLVTLCSVHDTWKRTPQSLPTADRKVSASMIFFRFSKGVSCSERARSGAAQRSPATDKTIRRSSFSSVKSCNASTPASPPTSPAASPASGRRLPMRSLKSCIAFVQVSADSTGGFKSEAPRKNPVSRCLTVNRVPVLVGAIGLEPICRGP